MGHDLNVRAKTKKRVEKTGVNLYNFGLGNAS